MPLVPIRASYKTPRLSAQTRTHQYLISPSPQHGLDFTQALTMQDPRAANVLENFTVRRSGSELRPGYKRWVSNLGGAATPKQVLTTMTYNPPRGAGSVLTPTLFAGCDDMNIYDVTAPRPEAFVPPVSLSIPGQIIPGRLSWTNFSTSASNYLCVCVAGGGYFTYDTVGGWVNRTASITGAGAGAAINFDFVIAWKNRLWFIVNNSADVYYLPVNSIAGAASNFDFGPLLTHGGDLKAMASWTLDAGNGVDDKLVLVSGGGDVLVYEGTDPASAASFREIGRWFIGRPPDGRRFMSKHGGDLVLITANGVDYMSRLLQGRSMLDPEGPADDAATRYNGVIGADVRASYGQNFWSPIFVSGEQMMVLTTPANSGVAGRQHVFSTLQHAWSQYVGIPMLSADTIDGVLFFGTPDGKVCKLFGAESDDELQSGTAGRAVLGRMQTAYIAPGDDVMALKRALLVMPMFLAPSAPQAQVQINTEWSSASPPGTPAYVPPVTSLWDISKWDQALWFGGLFTFTGWVGVSAMGVYLSLSLTLSGAQRTLFTSWKVVYEPGGIA